MEFTKNLMRYVQASWFFFTLFMSLTKVKHETKNHLLRLRKKKQQLNLLYFQQL
jgi:hypothetical protein